MITPNSAPPGLLKYSEPRVDCLQAVEDGAVVAGGHFDAEGGGDEGEVEQAEVGFEIPGGGVVGEEGGDRRGVGRAIWRWDGRRRPWLWLRMGLRDSVGDSYE